MGGLLRFLDDIILTNLSVKYNVELSLLLAFQPTTVIDLDSEPPIDAIRSTVYRLRETDDVSGNEFPSLIIFVLSSNAN